ncbi:porin [Paludibacterium purpuratum]|uniref:Putative porin n=1 Tax=Paludibacterium purpuratum TaxID=1144873 RepID=A0A4R7B5X6_9NEIS|nr:porin [Paludibacterium purpuratum]TDR78313.1 putative porin [Paludibacterium purpuratum]
MRTSFIPFILLPGVALADVTLYGDLKANVSRHSYSQGAGQGHVDDAGSSFGAKGNESLGEGLKAHWQVEWDLGLDGNKKFGLNETFVGLEDADLGKLRIGYLNSALKDLYTVNQWQSGGKMVYTDQTPGQQAADNFGADGLNTFTNPGQRMKNAIRFDTPLFNGFGGNIAYGFGENRQQDSTRASDMFSLGLSYRPGAWFAAYAYQREANPCSAAPAATPAGVQSCPKQDSDVSPAYLHYLEGGYRDDLWLVALAWQQAHGYDWTDGLSGDSRSTIDIDGQARSPAQARLVTRQVALSIARTFGRYTPKLTLAHGWDQRAGGGTLKQTGYRQWIVGMDYPLSKRTIAGIAHGRQTFAAMASPAVNQRSTTFVSTSLTLSHKF